MAIDITDLLEKMARAASASFGDQWPAVRSYAEIELKKIAADIAYIEQEFAAGRMNATQARLQLHLQANASKIVLLTAKGMTILAVEAAINAALGVIKDTTNAALGFALL